MCNAARRTGLSGVAETCIRLTQCVVLAEIAILRAAIFPRLSRFAASLQF